MLHKDNLLIVSCQAEGNDPFNSPEGVALFARAAEMGGADGIRSEGVEKTKQIINEVNIPVIGLVKSVFDDNTVRITGRFKDVENLLKIGCNIIAIDGTLRIRENLTGPEFITKVKRKYQCLVLADISTKEEAIDCQNSGADFVSTTLNGYTPETKTYNNGLPNFKLIEDLVSELKIPVFAEGRISTPSQAKKLINLGLKGIIIGTSITRPRLITNKFVNVIK
jgi:N-acylglucosamine-6-phosphate 2-epimerase